MSVASVRVVRVGPRIGEQRSCVAARHHTDGITEARSAGGEPFGVDRLTDFAVRALADDATLLLLRWNGPVA